MLPLRLLMMPPPLMMPLAHLWAHLLTLTADDDGAGRLFSAHADARAEVRHHTYENVSGPVQKVNGPETNQRSRKKLGPLLKPARGLFAWRLRRQRSRINLECGRGPEVGKWNRGIINSLLIL